MRCSRERKAFSSATAWTTKATRADCHTSRRSTENFSSPVYGGGGPRSGGGGVAGSPPPPRYARHLPRERGRKLESKLFQQPIQIIQLFLGASGFTGAFAQFLQNG